MGAQNISNKHLPLFISSGILPEKLFFHTMIGAAIKSWAHYSEEYCVSQTETKWGSRHKSAKLPGCTATKHARSVGIVAAAKQRLRHPRPALLLFSCVHGNTHDVFLTYALSLTPNTRHRLCVVGSRLENTTRGHKLAHGVGSRATCWLHRARIACCKSWVPSSENRWVGNFIVYDDTTLSVVIHTRTQPKGSPYTHTHTHILTPKITKRTYQTSLLSPASTVKYGLLLMNAADI